MDDEQSIRDKYLDAIGLSGADKKCERRNALNTAHDLRKFEIELIWKRSGYLWGFQVVAFTAFGVLTKEAMSSPMSVPPNVEEIFNVFLIFLVSIFGFVTSLLWYATAKSSKVWFYNWEKHIDFLEVEFTGDLYKTLYFRDNGTIYSLTGVNEVATILSISFWSMLSIVSTILFLFSIRCADDFQAAFIIMLIILAAIYFRIGEKVISSANLQNGGINARMKKLSEDIPLGTANGEFHQRLLNPQSKEK